MGKSNRRIYRNIRGDGQVIMAIVGGIIARANHHLRVDGVEKYKEYLSKKFISLEEHSQLPTTEVRGLEE